MSYKLIFSKQVIDHIEYHKKSGNKVVLKKILLLLNELALHPTEGAGKPEQLKYNLSGFWSRRINLEHRLVYEITDESVHIHSALEHYE